MRPVLCFEGTQLSVLRPKGKGVTVGGGGGRMGTGGVGCCCGDVRQCSVHTQLGGSGVHRNNTVAAQKKRRRKKPALRASRAAVCTERLAGSARARARLLRYPGWLRQTSLSFLLSLPVPASLSFLPPCGHRVSLLR